MLQSTWPNGCNTKFFAFNSKPKDNVQLTEFISGRVVGYRKNTKAQMQIKCQVRFSKNELATFWSWFNDTIGQTSGAWLCSALGTGYYRFISVPEPQDTEQKYRILSLEIEEVL